MARPVPGTRQTPVEIDASLPALAHRKLFESAPRPGDARRNYLVASRLSHAGALQTASRMGSPGATAPGQMDARVGWAPGSFARGILRSGETHLRPTGAKGVADMNNMPSIGTAPALPWPLDRWAWFNKPERAER